MSDVLDYLEGDLPDILRLLQSSDVRELELREGDVSLRLRRAATGGIEVEALPDAPDVLALVEPQEIEIVAPLVGTFYRAEEPDAPPMVDEGDPVDDDTVVGIIEALQVLNVVRAGCRGVITRVLATDGQPVQYNQSLFTVTPHE